MIARPLAACIIIVALGGRAYAQRAEADAEFQRGRTLLARGQVAEACAAFEASMKLDPEKGTLYNLGLCHERLGKLASAWSELDELSRTDTNTARGEDSGRRAAALLPRLTHMHLVVEGNPDGLAVTRDKIDVTPLVGKDAPVDPGIYTFVATARDREPSTLEVDLTAEGKTVDVTIPALRAIGEVVDASVFPIELPRRPILIPHGMAEISLFPSILTSANFDRTAIDAGVYARARLGPFEIAALAGFDIRTAFKLNKPNPWDTVGVVVKYPIQPGLVVGMSYTEDQPLRDDLRGSDLGANIERKLLVYPKIAVDGRTGFVFSQREDTGNAFVLVGEGRIQASVFGPLSLEGFAGLDLNLAGSLYNYTVGLTVAALALYVIKPNLDVFAQAASSLLPDASLQTYTFGVSWRTR